MPAIFPVLSFNMPGGVGKLLFPFISNTVYFESWTQTNVNLRYYSFIEADKFKSQLVKVDLFQQTIITINYRFMFR